MLDITQFAAADTSFMHLKSPVDEEPLFEKVEGEKLPVGIIFHSPGSAAYEAANTKRTNRTLVRQKRKIDLTADILRADSVDFLADLTVSFEHLGYPPADGATGEDLFKALYRDRRYAWVLDQANAHLADWGNFTKGSATS